MPVSSLCPGFTSKGRESHGWCGSKLTRCTVVCPWCEGFGGFVLCDLSLLLPHLSCLCGVCSWAPSSWSHLHGSISVFSLGLAPVLSGPFQGHLQPDRHDTGRWMDRLLDTAGCISHLFSLVLCAWLRWYLNTVCLGSRWTYPNGLSSMFVKPCDYSLRLSKDALGRERTECHVYCCCSGMV